MARNAMTRAEVEAILAAQASREERRAVADDIIDNDGDLAQLQAQVAALDRRYREIARSGANSRKPGPKPRD
jgi:dephospho-CoA kinase